MASGDERRLGDRIARELYRDPDYLDDPVLADYVQGVWQPLLAAARARGDLSGELDERFAWQILLGRDRSVNAFALPGGYLGVHLGLLAVVSNRDELASVLGHELSHVTQRHISRLIAKDAQQTPWVIGAMILGALAASKSPEAGNALIVGGQALSAQSQLNFSRDMEREADRIGFGVMTQAGFEAQGFVTMFDKLQQAARLNDSGAYPYLRSHPLTTERIADMQSRLPLGAPRPAMPEPTVLHAMMATRAKVLSNSGADALRSWQDQVQDSALTSRPAAQQAAAWYGAALAALRLRNVANARSHLSHLQALVTQQPDAAAPVRWLAAEIDLTARDRSRPQVRALADTLCAAATTTPATQWRRPELLLQAQAAHHTNQSDALDAAAQRLQTWLVAQPQDALAWQWLASLYAAQGQSLRALRAEAEAQAARLDYTGALDRLKAAQDRIKANGGTHSSADLIDAQIIDARVRKIDVLAREQTLAR
ncbi:MAG: peptidase M48 [Comamonadaceae bacterium CG1_02_60_18]|nr:MAG: peptidase M48 [Comamonadaceae bacterium CG1_02_60_18]